MGPHRVPFAVVVVPDVFGVVVRDPRRGVGLRKVVSTVDSDGSRSSDLLSCESDRSLTWTMPSSCCGIPTVRLSKKKGESENVGGSTVIAISRCNALFRAESDIYINAAREQYPSAGVGGE
jgi:hypothetical protein